MKKLTAILLLIVCAILINPSLSNGHGVGHDHSDQKSSKVQSPTDKLIESYKLKIDKEPNDYYYHVKLGELYIQKGREKGVIENYKRAEKALMRASELNPDDYKIYLHLGRVSSYKHDFRAALTYADKAIGLRPDKAAAYALKGDAYLELGDYDGALKAYALMLYLGPDFDSYTRVSRIRFLIGDTEGAVKAMEQAIDLSRKLDLPEENMAWADVMLGSLYFDSGEPEKSELHYHNALVLFENYYLALEHLGELYFQRGEYGKAASYYRRAIDVSPKPEYYLALGNVYRELGDTARSRSYYKRAEEQYEEYQRQGIKGHSRDLVLHYVDNNKNLDRALELALLDSEGTEDIYAYDTLAWIYYKMGDTAKAEEAMNKALRLGTEDALLYYHAGMIHYEQHKVVKAKEYLGLSVAVNPQIHGSNPEEAGALLGEIIQSEGGF